MISLDEMRTMPEFARLRRAVIVAAVIWLAVIAAAVFSLSLMSENERRLSDSERILNAATTIKSYPQRGAVSGAEPLTAVSAIIDKAGLQSKVSQLSSSPTGLVLQANRLYPGELGTLVDEMQKNRLNINTAEIRVLSSQRDGRLLNVSITIEGERE